VEALLFRDASSLVKRYVPEMGSPTVGAVFAQATVGMATSYWGYLETFSILVRRLNGHVIDEATFTDSVSALQSEVLQRFALLGIDDPIVLKSQVAVRKHNLNATDAAIVTMLLEVGADPEEELLPVLIASDRRLLRAAEAEGLLTFNPEEQTPGDVTAFLATVAIAVL